jgi:hypothetical protein
MLDKQQNDFIQTINDGPAALNPELFSGPIERVLLGLKAHANTISHARIVALEQTFPLTRNAMGDARFNALCRDYCETEQARRASNNQIGESFASYLEAQNVAAENSDLCRIEWAALECYHAPEYAHLTMEAIGTLNEADMLNLSISPHPSARLVWLQAPLSAELAELNAGENTAAILIVRPQATVHYVPLCATTAEIFEASKKCGTMGNLLSFALELTNEQGQLEPLLLLIGAGALTRVCA